MSRAEPGMGTTTWAAAGTAKTEPGNRPISRVRIPMTANDPRFENRLIFIFYSFIEQNSKTVFSSASIKQEVKEQLG
jgi:hypothetical protein